MYKITIVWGTRAHGGEYVRLEGTHTLLPRLYILEPGRAHMKDEKSSNLCRGTVSLLSDLPIGCVYLRCIYIMCFFLMDIRLPRAGVCGLEYVHTHLFAVCSVWALETNSSNPNKWCSVTHPITIHHPPKSDQPYFSTGTGIREGLVAKRKASMRLPKSSYLAKNHSSL